LTLKAALDLLSALRKFILLTLARVCPNYGGRMHLPF
jgi:hypothetical protein